MAATEKIGTAETEMPEWLQMICELADSCADAHQILQSKAVTTENFLTTARMIIYRANRLETELMQSRHEGPFIDILLGIVKKLEKNTSDAIQALKRSDDDDLAFICVKFTKNFQNLKAEQRKTETLLKEQELQKNIEVTGTGDADSEAAKIRFMEKMLLGITAEPEAYHFYEGGLKEIHAKAETYRYAYIDDIPAEILEPYDEVSGRGDPNYELYKCRTSFWNQVGKLISALLAENIVSNEEHKTIFLEYLHYLFTQKKQRLKKADKVRRTTPAEINYINSVLDTILLYQPHKHKTSQVNLQTAP